MMATTFNELMLGTSPGWIPDQDTDEQSLTASDLLYATA